MREEKITMSQRQYAYEIELIEQRSAQRTHSSSRRLICFHLSHFAWSKGWISYIDKYEIPIKKLFPEFYRSKPLLKFMNEPWWGYGAKGYEKRIKALEKAIRICQRKLKFENK
jgi:hypothetical protein